MIFQTRGAQTSSAAQVKMICSLYLLKYIVLPLKLTLKEQLQQNAVYKYRYISIVGYTSTQGISEAYLKSAKQAFAFFKCRQLQIASLCHS